MIFYEVYLGDEEGLIRFLSKERAIKYVLSKCPNEAIVEQELTGRIKIRVGLKRIKDADSWEGEADDNATVKVKYEVVSVEILEVTKHVQEEVKEKGKPYWPRWEWTEEKVIDQDVKLYVDKNNITDEFLRRDGDLVVELPSVYLEWAGSRYVELKTIERTVWVAKEEIKFMDEEVKEKKRERKNEGQSLR